MKYRKRPVVIDAIHFLGENWQEVMQWVSDHTTDRKVTFTGDTLTIGTLEGVMTATPGDYIIRGVQGEIYPCKPDIFAKTYEPA